MIVAGDRAAFDALMREHYAPVVAFLRRMAGSDAEDAAQRTFLNAWKAIGTYDASRPLRPWLLAIALNEVRKLRRGPRDEEPVGDVVVDGPLAASILEQEDARRRMLQLVADLPLSERSVMLLRFQHGLTPAEIAEVEGVSVNAVRIRLTRAVQRLRKEMK